MFPFHHSPSRLLIVAAACPAAMLLREGALRAVRPCGGGDGGDCEDCLATFRKLELLEARARAKKSAGVVQRAVRFAFAYKSLRGHAVASLSREQAWSHELFVFTILKAFEGERPRRVFDLVISYVGPNNAGSAATFSREKGGGATCSMEGVVREQRKVIAAQQETIASLHRTVEKLSSMLEGTGGAGGGGGGGGEGENRNNGGGDGGILREYQLVEQQQEEEGGGSSKKRRSI